MTNLLNAFTNTIKHWYIPLILGVIFLISGIYIFTTPLKTYLTLSVIFSISFIVSGLLDIVFAVQNNRTLKGWGWYLVSGLLTLIIGLYLISYPGISIVILPFVAGFTLLFRSFQLLGFSFDLKEMHIVSWGNLAVASVLGIIFSFLLLANPFFAGMSLVTLTAITFIVAGLASIVLAFNLKKVKDIPSKLSQQLKSKIDSINKEVRAEMKMH